MGIKGLKQLMSKPILSDTRNIIDLKKLNDHKFTIDNLGRGINNYVNWKYWNKWC